MDEIRKLFGKRDKAVSNNNDLLFLGTQIDEIQGSSTEGYLSLQKLESKVLSVYPEDNTVLTKKAFVMETYHHKGKKARQGFLVYHLVNTVKGWKIFKIAY
jgi:hypothetical protein